MLHRTQRRTLCTAARRALALCLALGMLLPPPLAAQEPGASRYQIYPLRSASVAEVADLIRQAMKSAGSTGEVIVDEKGRRLLVRGSVDTHEMARELIDALDRAASEKTDEPKLLAYNVPAAAIAARLAEMQAAFGKTPGVRIAPDERASQIVVVAPGAVHDEIARRWPQPAAELPAPQAAPVLSVPANGPLATAMRTLRLRELNWPQIEARLRAALGARISATVNTGDRATLTLSLPGGGNVRLAANVAAGQVQIEGEATATDRCVRLLEVLDQPLPKNGSQTRIFSLSPAAQAPALEAMHAVDDAGSIPEADATRLASPVVRGPMIAAPSSPLFAKLMQPRPDAPAANAAQTAAPAQPAVPNQPGAPAPPEEKIEDTLGTGLVGPVQIEFLEGLDVMIVSGNDRDVERVLRIIDEIEKLSGETEPLVQVHEMKHVASEAMAALVNQLYTQVLSPRQGRVSITALVKPNALLLIGREESVKAIEELIDRLDQPVLPEGQFAVFALKHAAATAVANTVQQFFANRTGLGGRVQVTTDFRTNALIIQASPRDVAEAAALIQRLDAPSSEAVNELRIYPLRNSLAVDMAAVLQQSISTAAGTSNQTGRGQQAQGNQLQQAFGGAQQGIQDFAQGLGGAGGAAALGAGQQPQGTAAAQQSQQAKSLMLRFMTIDSAGKRQLSSGILTDVRITADPRANALVVSAPAEALPLLEALIQELDHVPAVQSQIKVFTIINGDAASLVQMLQNLFGQQRATNQFGAAAAQGAAASFQGETPLVGLRFTVDERTNSIIATGSASDLNVVEAVLLRLDESDVRQRESKVYRLRNAPALDVANAINEYLRSERAVQQAAPAVISPFEQMEREVVVVPEPVSNSLIVAATPRYFEDIRKLVEELDARPPMVMIQVLIAEVVLNNTDEFGVELGLQDSVLFDRSLLGDLVTTTNSTQTPQGNTVVTTTNQIIQGANLTPGFVFNSPNIANSGSDLSRSTSSTVAAQGLSNFSVGRTNNDLGFGGLVLSASSQSVSVLIRALQECRRLEVLSRPQVMTLDNQPAFIQVGARVPRVNGVTINQTGQVNNVTDVNVGLILGVTPRISPDGLVVMEIDAEKSALGPEQEGVPISVSVTGEVVRQPVINTTTAQTTVSATSGQTIVLGGLITKEKSTTHRRIPALASIPILGNLFRYDMLSQRRTELLIIMTPHIIRTERDSDRLKQIEASRMSWCLADVERLNGPSGLRTRGDAWADAETMVVYPDNDPSGRGQPILPDVDALPPSESIQLPPGAPSNAQPLPDISQPPPAAPPSRSQSGPALEASPGAASPSVAPLGTGPPVSSTNPAAPPMPEPPSVLRVPESKP